MKSFRTFIEQLNESLDSLSPKEITFGSNADFWDENPYSDKKFSQFVGSLYQTLFKVNNIFFRILFDKKTKEISFQVSLSDDVSSFTDEKLTKGTEIVPLFSYILYILPFLIKQFSPNEVMFKSKDHTKKLYDALFNKSKGITSYLASIGFKRKGDIIKNSDGEHSYYFEKIK